MIDHAEAMIHWRFRHLYVEKNDELIHTHSTIECKYLRQAAQYFIFIILDLDSEHIASRCSLGNTAVCRVTKNKVGLHTQQAVAEETRVDTHFILTLVVAMTFEFTSE